MRTPLRYQITEFDCGPTSLLNAFSFLYEREDIPALIVKQIFKYTLDRYDKKGNLGNGGTSEDAVEKLSESIAHYTDSDNFGIKCQILEGQEVTVDKMKDCLENQGVVFAKCQQEAEHYIIITKIKNNKAYIFDPYFLEKNYYNHDRQIKIVTNKPFSHNRIVNLKRIFSNSSKDFSLGPADHRECVLINRSNSK